ncbi:MAG TPA: ATP-dependent DNA helicase [Verrucomicrobiae bacterium]|nr:ATP-dependent DNA helicase [Verrucomicrobiae bacterium]
MAVKIDLAKRKISLGVGDLVAEPLGNAKHVAGLSMWTRLALGRETHVNRQRSQAVLHEGYAREIVVRYSTTVDDFAVTIQGRIDGVFPPLDGGLCVVEEIKSVVAPPLVFAALDAKSYPHYVEQLRLYCFLLREGEAPAEPREPPDGSPGGSPSQHHEILGRLVFVNAADGTTKEVEIGGPFDDCAQLIAGRVRALIALAQEEQQRHGQRRTQSGALRFPHDNPRKYQDEMMAAVERALTEGRHLLVSAPSGIGKTAGALYPAVRHALANDRRAFFVTAKNTQQQIVVETLRKLGIPTAVFFRARETMCINDVYACREEFCQHLRDFKAKLQATGVADRLLAQRLITPEAMMEAGRGTRLCPFELALLEAELTDVIVCDYNYVFDPQVYFRRFFQEADYSNAILIIDEAHNLVQRAMDYYSPSLSRRQIRDLKGNLRHVEPSLAKELKKFLEQIEDFFRNQARRQPDEYSQLEAQDADKFLIHSPRAVFDELKPTFNKLTMRYLLDKTTSGRAIPDDPVDEFFSAFGQFCAVLAMDGEEFSYLFDTTNGEALKILCKDPSRQLAQRLEGFHSVIAMSATLEPVEFYARMLGFDPERTDRASFPSPFPRENRRIIVVPTVSTTFRVRAAHYEKIARVIVTTASSRPGNYMALFPSYEFMRGVAAKLTALSAVTRSEAKGLAPNSGIPLPSGRDQNDTTSDWDLIVQEPKMTEQQRQALVGALTNIHPPKLVFAVQGGLFAEGIDYPGETLSGVIVVSPALPQVSFERELMRRYYEDHYGKGFEFAYLYPGMNRVIQSVGRLIRSEADRGVAVLVCQRFAQPQYSTLFPPDWSESMADERAGYDLAAELAGFWASIGQNPRQDRVP